MPIQALGASGAYSAPAQATNAPESGRIPNEAEGGGFAEALGNVIREANRDQVNATQQALDLALHGRGTIHDAMVAVDKAEGSFRLLMEMRNRLIEGVNRLLETQL